MKAIGICLGASSINIVEISNDNNNKNNPIKILKSESIPHEGNPKKVLLEKIKKYDISKIDYITVTGRKFRHFVELPNITEPESTEIAYDYVLKNLKKSKNNKFENFGAIVSAGGETFMVYSLGKDGKISNVYTGNKCASGTGEFFLQQIRRMDLSINEAIDVSSKEEPHKVTGRCSVFCKSDCTHALNKGIPKGQVTAGLSEMMAKKISELLAKIPKTNIMVVGGTAQNNVVMDFLKKDVSDFYVPKEAAYFEALGAAIYALKNKIVAKQTNQIFKTGKSSFSFLKPIKEAKNMVVFKDIKKSTAKKDDICIIGLDVGSTTTKAVLLRIKDNAILASCYLRTNGNPIKASRNCYKDLSKQINSDIKIIGLGVTGSGRHIAGLHALTDGIINEIIAHATAAVYFDEDVDTIFEIGGQDAKYTYITNSVPSDYAMNEACSAGTGSFLEESAKESLGINYKEIGNIAMKGDKPPNFNDQCSAFISSDIKTAFQEGINKENVVAGLVYSVCMNYANRVKGNRQVGKKVFMQGGVCYNKAVPIAMAALTGKKIIVPPEPGLMGAFGVALEIKDRVNLGLLDKQEFNLKDLEKRDVEYGKNFVCFGGEEKCDRKCEIMTIKILGKTYPFGGACDKYYNQRLNKNFDVENLDLVKMREVLLYEKYVDYKPKKYNNKTIGINKSFLTNTFYPLYYNFFSKLGYKIILSDKVVEKGTDRRGSSFCYPAEIAHGLFQNLIDKKPDQIFLPIITELPIKTKTKLKKSCVFVMAEHAYLRTAFKDNDIEILSPVLNFSNGIKQEKNIFINLAKKLGHEKNNASEAFDFALEKQNDYFTEVREIGKKTIKSLEKDKNKFGVVLFGRSYNAFAKEANMGIPHKFASRGTMIIPSDFIPIENEKEFTTMYWAQGQTNLMASSYVKKHPQLYGSFVTNFSCGPDSFIISYFRDIMGIKPSLTLELDSHTADAGLNTRIDAFLDIVKSYRELEKEKKIIEVKNEFKPAETVLKNNKIFVQTANGTKYSLTNKKVNVLIPTMGRMISESFAATFKGLGINAIELPDSDMKILNRGRANTTCKECLPMLLTTGGLLNYIDEKKKKDEILVYFMPASSGPCRFGQYNVYLRNFIKNNKLENVAVLTLSDKNNYAGFGIKAMKATWKTLMVADAMTDIRNTLRAIAKDPKSAIEIFEKEWIKMKNSIAKKSNISLKKQILKSSLIFKKIPLKIPFKEANKIALIGEIYVRQDQLSRQNLIDRLAKKNIIVKIAPVAEFIYYINYLSRYNILNNNKLDAKEKIKLNITYLYQTYQERKIKRIFEKSGLYDFEMIDIAKTIDHAAHLMSKKFTGEAILTTGLALREVLHSATGVISIGPFGCMPSRVAESLLNEEMTVNGKIIASDNKSYIKKYKNITNLPFLAIETDGNPYPQVIEARIETFILQSQRIHEIMNKQ
jgi:predicted CoA-substrate-specific enzyme activase